jgi:hypothetical protein
MKVVYMFFVFVALSLRSAMPIIADLIPSQWLNSVVAIGSAQSSKFQTEGTGFLYGRILKKTINTTTANKSFYVFIVTNTHVLDSLSADTGANSPIYIRLNSKKTNGVGYLSISRGLWFSNKDTNIDISIAIIDLNQASSLGYGNDFIQGNLTPSRSIAVGDGVFVLGFPSIADLEETRNYTVVRQGCIARIDQIQPDPPRNFLVDSLIYPGNSGSPVILKPESIAISGTVPQNNAAFIGIATKYRMYTNYSEDFNKSKRLQEQGGSDLAIGGRNQVTISEENTGLAEVIPKFYIEQTIDQYLTSHHLEP